MAITKGNSRIVRQPLWSEDAKNRAEIRKQQLDMALADPQPGRVERRRGEQIRNARGQDSSS